MAFRTRLVFGSLICPGYFCCYKEKSFWKISPFKNYPIVKFKTPHETLNLLNWLSESYDFTKFQKKITASHYSKFVVHTNLPKLSITYIS